jgi:hypothetical protein
MNDMKLTGPTGVEDLMNADIAAIDLVREEPTYYTPQWSLN